MAAAKEAILDDLRSLHYQRNHPFKLPSGDKEVSKLVAFNIAQRCFAAGKFTLANGAAGTSSSGGRGGHGDSSAAANRPAPSEFISPSSHSY
jgi:hypothetical protein